MYGKKWKQKKKIIKHVVNFLKFTTFRRCTSVGENKIYIDKRIAGYAQKNAHVHVYVQVLKKKRNKCENFYFMHLMYQWTVLTVNLSLFFLFFY